MIYLIYGNKHQEVRNKVRSIVDAQIAKKPDAIHFRITNENWKSTNVDELLSGQGLFVQKYIVVFDNLLREKDIDEVLFEKMKEFSESNHIFIFSEGELTKEILKKIEKRAEKVQDISKEKIEKKQSFQIFSLADAFGSRNKKELWVLYQKVLLSGVSAEEIHPILYWQVKAMLSASVSVSAEDAGLSPYVYSKSKRYASGFKEGELQNISSKLVALYHDTRRGIVEFDTALERFVLGL